MTGPCSVDVRWADGTYTFHLRIGEIVELEKQVGCGIGELYERMVNRRWYAKELSHTIRLALIGGGMSPLDALDKVTFYVEQRPLLESVSPAVQALAACLTPLEELKKKLENEMATLGDSPSQSSMETVQ